MSVQRQDDKSQGGKSDQQRYSYLVLIAEQEARQLIVQQCHFCMYRYIYIYMYAVTLGSARAYGGKYEL